MPYADKNKKKENDRKWYVRTGGFTGERKEQSVRTTLLRRYGITPERQEEMRAEQGNKCSICEEEFTGSPHTDHDHKTGRVRSLLCGKCNQAIGLLDEDPTRMRKAADYIERHKNENLH
jgi:hypothetical protein